MNMSIEEVLKKEGVYVSTTAGVSMYPMLRDRRDTIVVSPCSGRLKKYDVPLYKRGDKYVLHRILEVREDGYVIRGDNCLKKEYDITDEQILGVLTGFYRDHKPVKMEGVFYRAYVRLWNGIFPVRFLFAWAKGLGGKGKRFLKKVLRTGTKQEKTETASSDMDFAIPDMEQFTDPARKRAGFYLLDLVRAALLDLPAQPIPEDVSWEDVWQMARRHHMEGLSAYAVETLEVKPPENLWKSWQQVPQKILFRLLNFDVEREQIFAQMKAAGLSYMPVKGVFLAAYYPKPGMRTMSDNDILYGFVEKTEEGFRLKGASWEEQLRGLEQAEKLMDHMMEQRGYSVFEHNYEVNSYHKKPFFNYEMHKRLARENSPFAIYYENPWKFAVQDPEDPNCFRLSDENEYIYFLTHAYKHFAEGGCGIRLLTDAYVFRKEKQDSMDWDYIERELEKIHLTQFEKMVTEAVELAFHTERTQWTSEGEELLEFLLHCGTYGSRDVSFQRQMDHFSEDSEKQDSGKTAKLRYVYHRIFPEKDWWARVYPICVKHPYLKLFYLFYRIGKGLVIHPQKLKNEWKMLKGHQKSEKRES